MIQIYDRNNSVLEEGTKMISEKDPRSFAQILNITPIGDSMKVILQVPSGIVEMSELEFKNSYWIKAM